MNIGDILRTGAEREAAPVGARIRCHNLSSTWTKRADGYWVSGTTERHPTQNMGWLEDNHEDGYIVEAWPAEQFTIGMEVIGGSDTFAALPVGAVVQYRNVASRTIYRKVEPDLWRRVLPDDYDHISTDGGDRGNATGWSGGATYYLRALCGEQPTEEETGEGTGEGTTISDYGALTALPVGAKFWYATDPTVLFTVMAAGRDGYAQQDGVDTPLRVELWVWEGPANGGLLVTGVPSVEVSEPGAVDPRVGQPVNDREVYLDLPVGTVLRTTASGTFDGRIQYTLTKREDGDWDGSNGNTYYSNSLSLGGINWVESVPGTPAPVVDPHAPVVGSFIDSVEMARACPVGTQIETADEMARWAKQADGRWGPDTHGTLADHHLNISNWWRIVSLPGVEPETVPEMADESVITLSAHEEALAVARQQAREAAMEEVLTTLREQWDGTSFNEYEINVVLGELGLPEIDTQESVTVSVSVAGESNLTESDLRPLIEGHGVVTISDEVLVEWTLDDPLDFEFEVSTGTCACDQIEEWMVRDRLQSMDVTYSSFDVNTSCSND